MDAPNSTKQRPFLKAAYQSVAYCLWKELKMKTLEFKLTLNKTQAAQLQDWLEAQRRVWNWGLGMLKDFERFTAYNKADKAYAPCCPIPWEYRWQKEGEQFQPIPFSRIAAGRERRQCCPIPQPYRAPQIDRDSEYSLTPKFAHKLHPNKPWLLNCPYKITQSTIKLLAVAWAEYRKGKRKSPRFKSRSGKGSLKTLNDTQSANARVEGNKIRLPKLGWLKVRSLEKRWPAGTPVKTYRITKEPSGWYLLLVGEVPHEAPKPSKLAAGLDAGLTHILNDDAGHHIDIPSPLKRRLKRLKRLSRKAARQQKGSANQRKTYARIAKTHEKIRRERKSWHHKLSTFAVRKYDAIAVEKLNLAGMGKRPKPKLKADGSGYEPNKAKAKSGLNRSLRDAGIGALIAMLEAKAKTWGRRFAKVPAHHTSQTCNQCGAVDAASRQNQSTFLCTSCGHRAHADTNAARNIRDAAFPEFQGRYLALAGEFKPVEPPRVGAMKQEGAIVPPCGDAATIPNIQRDNLAVLPNGTPKSRNSAAANRRKRRSAQANLEKPIQLGFWDAAGET